MAQYIPIRVDRAAPVPIATQLAQQLTWLIASGEIPEGHDLPTMRQLAEQVDINPHTVRAAYQQLHTIGLVSMGRGRRVQVHKYDRTRPDPSVPDVPSFSFGMIIPGFAPFYAPLVGAVEAAAAEHPAMVILCIADDDPASALAYLDRLVAKRVDGIIIAAPLLRPPLSRYRNMKPALVFIDTPGADPGVEFDLEQSQYVATRHLLDHGHERIGFVTPPLEFPNVAPKHIGHRRALATADLAPEADLTSAVPDFHIGSGEVGTARLLDLARPPTAIAASSDSLALGAFHAIIARGLRIPEDVALVGNDDIEMAAIIRPALTTVSVPIADAGRRAVGLLRAIIAGHAPDPSQFVLDTKLVVRASCGCTTDD